MIKLAFRDKGRPGTVGYAFGLSEENIKRLKQGQPIKVDLAEMGGTGSVLIFYGKTEQDMARDLADLIGPETKVSIRSTASRRMSTMLTNCRW